MAYTKHGYHIPGTDTEPKPKSVARCGGPRLCNECKGALKAELDKQVTWCIDHNIDMDDCVICSPKMNKLNTYIETESERLYLGPGHVKNGTVTFDIYELSKHFTISFETIKKDN